MLNFVWFSGSFPTASVIYNPKIKTESYPRLPAKASSSWVRRKNRSLVRMQVWDQKYLVSSLLHHKLPTWLQTVALTCISSAAQVNSLDSEATKSLFHQFYKKLEKHFSFTGIWWEWIYGILTSSAVRVTGWSIARPDSSYLLMDSMKGYTNKVQQKLNEACAQQELGAIITLLLHALISLFLRCREEEENIAFFIFFLFKADILIK